MFATIVIPAYNRARALREKSLPSVFLQTDKDFEVIVIDDGSSDNTKNTVSNFEAQLNNIRYFRQEKAGVSAARNNGVNEARGEIIVFLDSDDELRPEYLEEVKKVFSEQPSAEIIIPGFILKDEFGKESYFQNEARPKWMIGLGGGIALRKSVFTEKKIFYDENLENFEDSDFGFRAAAACNIVFLNKPLYIYNFHSDIYGESFGNLSTDSNKSLKNLARFKGKNLEFYKSCGPAALSYFYFWEGTIIAPFDAAAARKSFWASFVLRKNIRSFIYFLMSSLGSPALYKKLHRVLIFLRRRYKVLKNKIK